ncbi:MAG: OprO/OprP family phosphate-selective porin [Bacteroides sp.]|nr:OprO/OprP family phosphate-selective porin [Bacteroides sp.]
MKRILLSCILILATYALKAQDACLNDVVNTLKDRISLAGYAQVGYTYDDAGEKASNTFDIKRVILMVNGKITDKWSCSFMYSFANTGKILEVYTEYKFLPQLTARFGQFKTMYTIENPMSSCFVELINCYSQSVNYLAGINGSDPLYGSSSGRDMGLLIYGDLFGKLVNYNLAVMNGQGINLKDKNNQKDIVGGLMVHPLEWLSVGGSFIKGKGCAVSASTINPDIAVGESYTRNRWSVGATIQTKPVSLRTEYLGGKDGRVKSDGYYATASVHVSPKLDLIASYDYLNKDKAVADKQSNYVAGVQYWFYPKCRVQAQYTYCDPHKGESSNLLQAQLQVRF